MKKSLILLIFFAFFISLGQPEEADYFKDFDYKHIIEKKGLLYLKADTTLVTGRVVKFNSKKVC